MLHICLVKRFTIEGCTSLQLFSAVIIPVKLNALLFTSKKQVSALLLYILIFFAFQSNKKKKHWTLLSIRSQLMTKATSYFQFIATKNRTRVMKKLTPLPREQIKLCEIKTQDNAVNKQQKRGENHGQEDTPKININTTMAIEEPKKYKKEKETKLCLKSLKCTTRSSFLLRDNMKPGKTSKMRLRLSDESGAKLKERALSGLSHNVRIRSSVQSMKNITGLFCKTFLTKLKINGNRRNRNSLHSMKLQQIFIR